jgi:hypothetical protein
MTTPSCSSVPVRWRTVLVAVALLAGLFAMHALTHHGEHVPSVTAGTPGTAGMADTGHGEHGEHGAPPEAPAEDHHGSSGVMTLCLAMLAGAAAWLLATAVRRRPARPLLLLPRRVLSGVLPPPGGRAHSPPGRWDLSVCRC